MKSDFNRWVHNFGQGVGAIILVLMVATPIVSAVVYDAVPDLVALLPTIFAMAMFGCPIALSESIAFTPIMGAGPVYMTYITGNTNNLKLPCAMNALNITGVENGTEEAHAVAMLGVGVSSFVVVLVVFLAIPFSTLLDPIFNSAYLKPGLDNYLPVIMGGVIGMLIYGGVKYFIVPLLAAFVLAQTAMNSGLKTVAIILISLLGMLLINKLFAKKQAADAAETANGQQ